MLLLCCLSLSPSPKHIEAKYFLWDQEESHPHLFQHTRGAHSRKERRCPLIFSSRIQGVIEALIEDKLEETNRAFAQAGDKVTINSTSDLEQNRHHCNLAFQQALVMVI
jgi:hypothetical protein